MGVAEHGEAVDDDGGIADHGDYLFGFEFLVGVVADGEDDGVDAFERGFQIFADANLGKALLVTEKAGPGVAGGRIGLLFFEFPLMFDIGIVDLDFGPHFGEFADD